LARGNDSGQLFSELLHPRRGSRPFQQLVHPVLGNSCFADMSAHDSADNGGGRVRIASSFNHTDDGLAKVVLIGQLGLNRNWNRAIDVSADALAHA